MDEYYSLHAVTEGLSQHFWELPLIPYYGLLWAWTLGGSADSDLWMRGLSIAAIASTAGFVASSAHKIAGRRAAYLAGMGVALAASMQELSHIARPYAAGTALAAVSTWLLARCVTRTAPSRRSWLSYGVILAVMVIVMPQAAVVIVAHGIYLIYARSEKLILKDWSLSLLLVVPVVLAGIALLALGPYSAMHAWLPPPTLSQIPTGILRIADASGTPSTAAAAFGLALVVLGLITAKGTGWILGAMGGALMIWIASQMGTSFWLAGSFGPLVPLVTVGAGVSLASIASWQQFLVASVLLMVAIPAYQGIRLERSGEADSRMVAHILEENVQESRVLFGDPTDAYSLRAMVDRYGLAGIRWSETRAPKSQYWSLYGDDACNPIKTWNVGGGGILKLCQGPIQKVEENQPG